MKVLPVTGNIIDVFWGEGWENWERFRRTVYKDGAVNLVHLSGKQIPKVLKVKLYYSQSPQEKK